MPALMSHAPAEAGRNSASVMVVSHHPPEFESLRLFSFITNNGIAWRPAMIARRVASMA